MNGYNAYGSDGPPSPTTILYRLTVAWQQQQHNDLDFVVMLRDPVIAALVLEEVTQGDYDLDDQIFSLLDAMIDLMRQVTMTDQPDALEDLFERWCDAETEIDHLDGYPGQLDQLFEDYLVVILNQLQQKLGGERTRWYRESRLYAPPVPG